MNNKNGKILGAQNTLLYSPANVKAGRNIEIDSTARVELKFKIDFKFVLIFLKKNVTIYNVRKKCISIFF